MPPKQRLILMIENNIKAKVIVASTGRAASCVSQVLAVKGRSLAVEKAIAKSCGVHVDEIFEPCSRCSEA